MDPKENNAVAIQSRKLSKKTLLATAGSRSSSPMSDSISLTDKGSNSSLLSSATRTICHVCQKQFSQYTCPRCNFLG
uniref:HIT-type domain-containing protein n=1 Tax=Kalanchoe fedtschenkoi TaxID=63787 RepID=A0A7N0VKY0_KALFE